jgi:hypothetical protein
MSLCDGFQDCLFFGMGMATVAFGVVCALLIVLRILWKVLK